MANNLIPFQMHYDSGIAGSLKRKPSEMQQTGKENEVPSGGHKRARKALLPAWTTSTPQSHQGAPPPNPEGHKVPDMFIIETPVSSPSFAEFS